MAIDSIAHYEILHRLGAGAYGTVYLATDTRLMRPVVVKIPERGSDAAEVLRSRMMEEARLASAIEHPNVCAIYEVGERDGRPYIVMQYVPGRTLKELIEAGAMTLRLALSVGIQIADGLAAAHALGILHRDLKPANVMLTEDGKAKILDFGLARRSVVPEAGEHDEPPRRRPDAASERFGTTAYMAPEQFRLRRSSEQSDIFSLGVILYEMVTGQHPFVLPRMDPTMIPHAIQTRQHVRPSTLDPSLPPTLDEILLKALARQPADRFRYAFEVRDALKTLMRDLFAEVGIVPGESAAVLPAPLPREPEKPGLLSGLFERLTPAKPAGPSRDAVAVLPFQDLDHPEGFRFHGFALSNAVATRLARARSLVVRPLSAFLSVSGSMPDPMEAGRRLQAERVLFGSYARSGQGFVVHWQLLEAAAAAIRCGGSISLDSPEVALLQSEVANRIYAELVASGEVSDSEVHERSGSELGDLSEEVQEEYLEARALLVGFAARTGRRDDLDRARRSFEAVLQVEPEFAPAHAGLGTVFMRYVRNGFGGIDALMDAERFFTRALDLDPELREAKLYRATALLWSGDKESARLDIQHLLRVAHDDADVCLAAGVLLQIDGLLAEALRLQGRALRLDPAVASRVYYYRARIHLMLGEADAARREVERGLRLAPDHALLRNTLAYWHLHQGDVEPAIHILESVLADDPNLRIAYPTLAMCYARADRSAEAAALVTDEVLAAAAADAETAYRLASYWVVAGDTAQALDWFRTAIYRGNENYTWFARNPLWAPLQDDRRYRKLLADLETVYRLNRARWERELTALPR